MIDLGFLRAVLGLDAPLLRRRRVRLRYGIPRGADVAAAIAAAARRAKVEQAARLLRELGRPALAELLEMGETGEPASRLTRRAPRR